MEGRARTVLQPRYLLLFALCISTAHGYVVSGTVVDWKGDLVAGADLWLAQEYSVQRGTSDALGRFKFDDVVVGPMDIVTLKEGAALGGITGQIVDSVEVHVTLGEPDVIDLRILDPERKPLGGARLVGMFVNDTFGIQVVRLADFGFPSLRSGDDGSLVLRNVPKGGNVTFTISHRAHPDWAVPTLPAGSKLDVSMPYGVTARGRVVDDAGKGVAEAKLSFFRYGVGGQREYGQVESAPDGFFTAMLPPGDFFIAARHKDHAMPDPVPVRVEDGEANDAFRVVMPPPHGITGRAGDENGRPVAGVRIAYATDLVFFEEQFTGADGRFGMTAQSGTGRLIVTPPPRWMATALPELKFDTQGERDLDVGDIGLTPLPTISGKVSMPEAGDLDRVLVTTVGLEPDYWTMCDAEGKFELRLEHAPREATVSLRAEHALRMMRRDVEVKLRKSVPLDVKLRPFDPNTEKAPSLPPNDLAPLVGKPAPEWSCTHWLNSPGDVTLASLRGKVVVLTFWGGFFDQGAGRRRIDELGALKTLYDGVDDVAIIGIHDGSVTNEEFEQYVGAFGVRFPVARDSDDFATFTAYRVRSIPQTVLIDKQGNVQFFYVDGRLLELIKELRRRP